MGDGGSFLSEVEVEGARSLKRTMGRKDLCAMGSLCLGKESDLTRCDDRCQNGI